MATSVRTGPGAHVLSPTIGPRGQHPEQGSPQELPHSRQPHLGGQGSLSWSRLPPRTGEGHSESIPSAAGQVIAAFTLFQLLLSRFGRVRLCATPETAAHQAPQSPQSLRFSRQEYWSGLPCPPPGDFPNPGRKAPAWVFREPGISGFHLLCPLSRPLPAGNDPGRGGETGKSSQD